MEIQSLSVVVPSGCTNKCKFCVSHMHREHYKNRLANKTDTSAYEFAKCEFQKRLAFARDNQCNSVVLTGAGEPTLDRAFLYMFAEMNGALSKPFRWIDIQTNGVLLTGEMILFLSRQIGVTTISLSLSDIFNSERNQEIHQTNEKWAPVDIDAVCRSIKNEQLNLRLSLNLVKSYDEYLVMDVFDRAAYLGANQITLRRMYSSGLDSEEDQWVRVNSCSQETLERFGNYIRRYGIVLDTLPFGATRYSIKGMSVVLDDDCMAQAPSPVLRYLILRPDCKLYSRWNDTGSILF